MPDTPSPSSRAEESQVKAIFLGRLQRLIRLRREYREDLNRLGLSLLDRAINATYRDCIEYGAEDAARPIMAAHRRAAWQAEQDESDNDQKEEAN